MDTPPPSKILAYAFGILYTLTEKPVLVVKTTEYNNLDPE